MIRDEKIDYTDGSTPLEGFLASSGKRAPLVIMCHAWRGCDDFICEKAVRLAELGYTAFALDIYGKGVLGNSPEENAALKKPFLNDRAFLRRRLLCAYKTILNHPLVDPQKVAALGFGFGGLCALDLARCDIDLQGVVSIYGHFDEPVDCTIYPIRAKVLVLHGYNDPIAPLSELAEFQEKLEVSGVDWQTHLFGGCYHAFATPSANSPKMGLVYNPQAAKRAWEMAERFLIETLS